MRYEDFRESIRRELQKGRSLTWAELRDRLKLPYDRPCPQWTKQLEREIGLARTKGDGRALLWSISPRRKRRAV
jgi:hypothetical protein